jgi:hypothetical protein
VLVTTTRLRGLAGAATWLALAACSSTQAATSTKGAGGAPVLFGQGGAPTTICEPGTTTSCYEGPAGTLGLGACHDGLKTCNADGTGFGPCEGQALPAAAEDCDTPVDDDCDGQAQNGCGCAPGTKKACYEGPSGTEGLGLCKAGEKACDEGGAGWGPCVGQVVPAAEDCDSPEDEDCDGSGACQAGGTIAGKVFAATGDQEALGVVVASSGDVVVVGRFQGTVDFGGGPLTSAGGDDVFVARFLGNGAFVWAARFGDAADQRANAVALDMAGNVFLVGRFDGTLDVGKTSLTSAGGGDAFVAALDKSGNPLWARSFGDDAPQEALAVASTPSGDVTIGGKLQGTADFGGGDVTSAGGDDAFLVELDVAGSFLWAKTFGDGAEQQVLGVAADAGGAVWATGSAAGTVDFGGGPLVAQGDDVFVVKLGPGGAHLASHLHGGAEPQAGRAIALDASGAPVLGGTTLGPIDLGTGLLPCGAGAGLFLARLDAAGATTGAVCFGAGSPTILDPLALAFSGAGDVLAAGAFRDKLALDGLALQASGGVDAYFARFSPALVPAEARRFGDGAEQAARAVAPEAQGGAWIAGGFAGTIDFGGKPVTSVGGVDAFLAKLTP